MCGGTYVWGGSYVCGASHMCEAGGAGSRCPTTCRRHQAVVPLPALPVIPPAASPARPGGPAAGSRVTSVSPAPGTPLLTELHRQGEAQGLFLLAGAQGSGSSWATAGGRWGAGVGGCRPVPEPGGQLCSRVCGCPAHPTPNPQHTPLSSRTAALSQSPANTTLSPRCPPTHPSSRPPICPSIRPDTPPALSPDTRLSLPPSTSVRPSTSPSAHPSTHYSTPPSQPPLHLPPPFCPTLSYLPALTPPNPQHSPQPHEAFSSADGDNRPPKGTDFGWVAGRDCPTRPPSLRQPPALAPVFFPRPVPSRGSAKSRPRTHQFGKSRFPGAGPPPPLPTSLQGWLGTGRSLQRGRPGTSPGLAQRQIISAPPGWAEPPARPFGTWKKQLGAPWGVRGLVPVPVPFPVPVPLAALGPPSPRRSPHTL